MFGSAVLDVLIGVVFLYLLLSLVCTVIAEGIARMFALRAGTLKAGIRNLLSDPAGTGLADEFYEHPLIKGLYRQGWFDRLIGRNGKPSYVASQTFTLALLDLVTGSEAGLKTFNEVRSAVAQIQNEAVKRVILLHMDSANNDPRTARENVEAWFDEAMERVSGWYKRQIQLIILVLAAAVSIVLGADTFAYAIALWNDTALRETIVASAQQAAGESPPEIGEVMQQLQSLQLPIGWSQPPIGGAQWAGKIAGLLLTTIAVSLGAPFWFDILNKVVRLRSSGDPPAR